jgi:hypothetical protein
MGSKQSKQPAHRFNQKFDATAQSLSCAGSADRDFDDSRRLFVASIQPKSPLRDSTIQIQVMADHIEKAFKLQDLSEFEQRPLKMYIETALLTLPSGFHTAISKSTMDELAKIMSLEKYTVGKDEKPAWKAIGIIPAPDIMDSSVGDPVAFAAIFRHVAARYGFSSLGSCDFITKAEELIKNLVVERQMAAIRDEVRRIKMNGNDTWNKLALYGPVFLAAAISAFLILS